MQRPISSLEQAWHRPQRLLTSRAMSEHQTAAELIQQGLVHHRAGQISLAMDRYTQVLRNDPQNADALYYIAADCLPRRPVSAGHRSCPPLTVVPARAGARTQSDRPGAAPDGRSEDALESFDKRSNATSISPTPMATAQIC